MGRPIVSHLAAIFVVLLIIKGLLHLPPLAVKGLPGLYTLVWLVFAVLVLLAHLQQALLLDRRPTTSSSVQKEPSLDAGLLNSKKEPSRIAARFSSLGQQEKTCYPMTQDKFGARFDMQCPNAAGAAKAAYACLYTAEIALVWILLPTSAGWLADKR